MAHILFHKPMITKDSHNQEPYCIRNYQIHLDMMLFHPNGYLPPANEVRSKVIFWQVSVILSTRGGGGAGLAFQYASQVTWQGVCLQEESASTGGLHPRGGRRVYIQGGLPLGGGSASGGLHPGGGGGGQTPPWYTGYYRIWSTSGWYTFYWNAFLSKFAFEVLTCYILKIFISTSWTKTITHTFRHRKTDLKLSSKSSNSVLPPFCQQFNTITIPFSVQIKSSELGKYAIGH